MRGVILTGITAVSSYLIFKESTGFEKCDFDFICKNCRKLKSCNLPEAKNYKQSKEVNHIAE